MPNASKERYTAIQESAMRILHEAGGVRHLDGLDDPEARRVIYKRLAEQLMAEHDCSYDTARRHIAKAARRQRAPGYEDGAWGGRRLGAGRKSGEGENS